MLRGKGCLWDTAEEFIAMGLSWGVSELSLEMFKKKLSARDWARA